MDDMDRSLHFSILGWRAWAPGLVSEQDWRQWLSEGQRPSGEERADVSFLPPMQRRRLGPMARSVFHVVRDCLQEDDAQIPMVFASRHGELARSYGLLESLARREGLSPRDFSLSVHNAILGLYSIQYANREAVSAVAAGLDTLPTGLMEAVVQAHARQGDCLFVWAEQKLPDFYLPYVPDDSPQVCLALHIAPPTSGPSGQGFRLALGSPALNDGGDGSEQTLNETAVLQAFMTGLLSGGAAWQTGLRQWRLEPS